MRRVPSPRFDAGEAEKYLAEIPSPTAPTVKRRSADTAALIEDERGHAERKRSGVRPIADEVRAASEAFLLDPSNAVTKVQRAIELDAFLPPTIEVAVVVSETIALVKPPTEPTPQIAEREPAQQIPQREPVPVVAAPAPVQTSQTESPPRRRSVAVVFVLAVMALALSLVTAAALRQQRLRGPDALIGPVRALLHRVAH